MRFELLKECTCKGFSVKIIPLSKFEKKNTLFHVSRHQQLRQYIWNTNTCKFIPQSVTISFSVNKTFGLYIKGSNDNLVGVNQ